MRLLWENLISNTTLTASSVKSGYSVESLKDYHLSKAFAFDGNNGNVVIDFGLAVSIKDFALMGVNITGSGTVTLEGNDTDSWGAPSYSTSITKTGNSFIVQDIDESYRYWRVAVADSSITNVSLGYMYFGSDHLQLPGMDPAISLNYANSTSLSFSASGQTYADKGFDYFASAFKFPIIKDYASKIDGISVATREDILEFWYTNSGATPIILLIAEKSLAIIPPFLGVVAQNTMTFKRDRTMGYYEMSFKFIETK